MSERTKKIIKGIVVALIFAFIVFVIAMNARQNRASHINGKPVVRIGVLFPLTGNMAHTGQTLKGAVEIAIDDANQNPDNRYAYEAVYEDTMLNLKHAALITSKLISVDQVDALISFSADIGHAVGSVAERMKTIHLSMSVDPAGAAGAYNFINWTQAPATTEKMARLIQDKGFKKVAVVSFNQQGALANSMMLNDKLHERGIASTLYRFNGDLRDFRLDIQKMRLKGTDLYVLRLFEPQMSIFIRQLREAGIAAPITSVELFNVIADTSVVEGLWFVDIATAREDVAQRIRAHNKSDTTYGTGMAYDDVMLIVRAFEAAPTKAEAVERLTAMKEYDGVVGRLTQDEHGIFESEAFVKVIRDGKAVPLE